MTNDAVCLMPPFHEDIFPSEVVRNLDIFYSQLYSHLTIENNSPFFIHSGRAILCGQLIGSVMNATSSSSSSVFTAYWPARGSDITAIDYGVRKKVRCVQYFCKHQLQVRTSDNVRHTFQHVLVYTYWKQKHPFEDYYGISATVCLNMHEPPSVCSFIPVKIIYSVCASAVCDVEIAGLHESVFIAVPIPLKSCL